ncbi:uncharacterized protein LOC104908155 [Beta vulgaris subsp. vulgaris]|uniref:uncharacterized protein LOC104908155 n=1 Tax=Beta vulgaris subsp. vulgaris TaxID=3555 RepID=UPI0025471C38|nr:uncharacterized protein LOC104908155 [Beta vulgaris subsp. vulgaris]
MYFVVFMNCQDDVHVEEVDENTPDYSEFFTTTTIFPTRKALRDWVTEVSRLHNMVIIIARSQYGEEQGLGNAKATLTCERSGRYRLHKSRERVDVEKFTGTKKRLCPFRLQAIECVGGGWSVYVINGKHNHDLPDFNKGRAVIGMLSKDELNLKLKTEAMCGRSMMQQLMKVIVDNNYLQWHREEVGTNVSLIIHIRQTDTKCLFLEIVGIVPTGKFFAVAFAWLRNEKEINYQWVMECVKQLFDPEKLLGVIVTDRELALINAVRQIFPNSAHLLCTRHIGKNVDNYVGKLTKNEDIVKAFRSRWYKLVDAPSVDR